MPATEKAQWATACNAVALLALCVPRVTSVAMQVRESSENAFINPIHLDVPQHNASRVGALLKNAPVFGTPIALDSTTHWARVWVSDLDNDGLADVIAGTWDSFAWFRNLGAGGFSVATVMDNEGANGIFAADLDNDGRNDVVKASGGSRNNGKVSWLRNLGGGTFAAESVIDNALDSDATWVFAIDLDNDGHVDVLSVEYLGNKVSWYKNMGGGTFAPQSVIATGLAGAYRVFATDVDGDGFADVFVGSLGAGGKIGWYRNTGAGGFEAESVLSNDVSSPRWIDAADLDDDGNVDILSASYGDNKVAWYRNLGGGSFSTQSIIASDCGQATVVWGVDMDLDGRVDVAASCRADRLVWYRNLGDGNFAPESTIWSGTSASGVFSMVPADLDNDGDIDVAAASYTGQVVEVVINSAPTPPTPSPVSATGDPHLQNIYGERFDLTREGKHALIRIPRGKIAAGSLLTVEADARRLGRSCADMYFQTINVTGAWADEVRAGGMTFTAGGARDETPQIAGWTNFGPLKLRVARGHTNQGIEYLNVYVKNLGHAGVAVGGLLGEDDHAEATQPDVSCRKFVSLGKTMTSGLGAGCSEAWASV